VTLAVQGKEAYRLPLQRSGQVTAAPPNPALCHSLLQFIIELALCHSLLQFIIELASSQPMRLSS
jgi:hypothetical protein